MSSPSDDPSVFHEPHLQGDGSHRADPTESKAERLLRDESIREDPAAASGQTIHEEPDIFGDRTGEVIARDWSCGHCGYNLRGLAIGSSCPECGHRELYRPAPAGSDSYQTWLRERLIRTSPSTGWFVATAAALLGGPLAVVGAMLESQTRGIADVSMLLLAAIVAPVAEETLKIAAAAWIVETRPYLFRRVEQVQFATVGAAFIFAAIENFIYLNLYVAAPSMSLVTWRWTVCVALHVGCTLVASRGLAAAWKQTITELRQPRISQRLRMLTIAIVIHGTYNLVMWLMSTAFPDWLPG